MNSFDSPAYKRSRAAYLSQCAFEYFVALLVSDAYIAKLLLEAGIDVATVGIISTLNQLSCVSSLLSIPLARRGNNAKGTVIFSRTVSMLLFMLLYFVPFISVSRAFRTVLVMVLMCGGHFFVQVSSPSYSKWSFFFSEPGKRARFSAVKEMVSLLGGILFTFFVGKVFDSYEMAGNLKGVFLLIAALIFALNILSLICLILMNREGDDQTTVPPKMNFLKTVKETLKNRAFVNIVILTTLYSFGQYLTSGFLGTYKTVELAYSVGTVQVINVFACLARFVLSMPFGIYSDRHSYVKGFTLAMLFAVLAFIASMLTAPGMRWMMIVHTVLYYISMAGTGQNMVNMCFSYVEPQNLVAAMAIRNSIAGVFGFIASMVGSRILALIQQNNNQLFGVTVYGQQVLSALSVLIILAAVVFSRRAFQKQ